MYRGMPFRIVCGSRHPLIGVAAATGLVLAALAICTRPGVAAPATGPAAAPASQPAAAAAPAAKSSLDTQIETAIRSGTNFLLSAFKDGELPAESDQISLIRSRGLHALCVYALLSAGQTVSDERFDPKGPVMKQLVEKLKTHDLSPRYDLPPQHITYARAMRAAALALRNKPDDRRTLELDVAWLIAANSQGGFTFDDRHVNPSASLVKNSRITAGNTPSRWNHTSDISNSSIYPRGSMAAHICHPGRGSGMALASNRSARVAEDSRTAGGIGVVPAAPWDNYNSQFAVMGVDAGAELGIMVPASFWNDVMKHWQSCQTKEGTWAYVGGEGGSLAMTAGGLASLIIGYDWQHRTQGMRRMIDDAMPDEVTRALQWLEQRGNVVQIPTPTTDYVGLDAFTVMRAAQRFGLKYIGGHDWYRELTQRFVTGQFPNGSWGRTSNMCGDTMIDTAYTVAFLSQGRRPPLMNKLRHDESEWQHHPHDLLNLAKFATTDLERPYRWQVVDLSHDGADWVESPILYITGENAPRLMPEELAKIKAFVDAGGMIFSHADGRGRSFTDWVNKTLAPAVLPAGAQLKPLPEDHQIYNFGHKLKSKPKLMAAGDQTRFMLVHSPNDLAAALDGPLDRDSRNTYELGVNLAVYAQGKLQRK